MQAWLQLMRISGLVTITANLLTAVIVAVYINEGLSLKILAKRLIELSGWHAVWIVIASMLLYCTGMIWNDIADSERDRTLNPKRPLPSGRITLPAAYLAGLITAIGALIAAVLGDHSGSGHGFFACGVVLSLIFLYNLVTKDVPWLGSINMGLIRATNAIFALLILGPDYLKMSVLAHNHTDQLAVLAYPITLGVYVCGLTLLSELEDRACRRWEVLAAGLLIGGSILAAAWMLLSSHWIHNMGNSDHSLALLGLGIALIMGCLLLTWLTVSVMRPWWAALQSGSRPLIRSAVISALGGMIVLDAVIATSANPFGGAMVACLIVVYLFSRFIGRME